MKTKTISLVDVVLPVLVLGRVSGITPFDFHISSGKSKTILIYRYNVLNIISIVAFFISSIIVTIQDMSWMVEDYPKIFLYSEIIQDVFGGVWFSVLMITRYLKRDKLANYFQFLYDSEKFLEEIGCEINYLALKRNISIAVILQLIEGFCLIGFIAYLNPILNGIGETPYFFIKYIPISEIKLTQFIFTLLVYLIYKAFNVLNQVIPKIKLINVIPVKNTILHLLSDLKQINVKQKEIIILEKLELFCKVYVKLCDCSFMLGEYFSLAIFAILAGSSMGVLFNAFYIMTSVADTMQGVPMNWDNLTISLTESLLNSVNIISVIYVCNRCEQEVSYYYFSFIVIQFDP